MSKKLDHKFWAKYFKVYDVLNMVIPYQELLNTILKELDVKKGDVILDAGCGTGNLGVKLKAKGAKVFGVDYCIEALDVYKLKDPKAEVMVHDLTQPLPFPDAYFNKIASNNVIYALPVKSREAVFKEFYRVLKPGGIAVISNVHKGFSPLEIYKDHLRKELKEAGVIRLGIKIIRMLVPTLKMFYYNALIKKENSGGGFSFMAIAEQRELFKKAGFKKVGENIDTYSNQAFLNTGQK